MSKHKPLHPGHLPRNVFIARLSRNILFGVVIIGLSLGMGMLGYKHFEGMSWIDAYINASMILAGMGPVATMLTHSGKVFAGLYALFSGAIFLIVISIVFAPVVHRFFHTFHIVDDDAGSGRRKKK